VEEELKAILEADLGDQSDAAKLEPVLYTRCYAHSILDGEAAAAPNGAPADLVEQMEKANTGVTTWDEGWRIDQYLQEGCVLARKGGAARPFRPGEYLVHTGIGCAARRGAPLSVLLPAGSRDVQPGFWFAFGTTVTEFDPGPGGLRFYWNVSAEGVPKLVAAVSRALNRFQVPFHMRCHDKAAAYPRRDAALVYLPRRYYPVIAMLLERIHEELRPWLSASTPLFTKRLADGLGLAEDSGESFGRERCRILAAAMVESAGQPVEERLAAVRRHFEQNRLQPDRPWLNPDSNAEYPYPFLSE